MSQFASDVNTMIDRRLWNNAAILRKAKPVNDLPSMGVDDKGQLLINPEFWNTLSWSQKVQALQHERLHLILKHHKRGRALAKQLPQYPPQQVKHAHNVVADAHINEHLPELKSFGISWESLIEKHPEMKAAIDMDVDAGTRLYLSLQP